MNIRRNLAADNGTRMHGIVSLEHDKYAEKLASGFKINRAADDVAYFSVSENMRSQVRGLLQADRNCQDGISMVQAATSAFNEMNSMLQRGRELSVQAASATVSDADRQGIQEEINQLKEEIGNMNTTTFNQVSLFAENSNFQSTPDPKHNSVIFQVGPLAGQYMSVHIFSMDTKAMGIDGTSVLTETDAGNAIDEFQDALDYVSVKRSYYGAIEGRLNHTISQVGAASEDMTDAESKIRDTNMADAMVHYATTNILMQSGISVIAQANQTNSLGVSSLLGWL